jgi:hypothetical protein
MLLPSIRGSDQQNPCSTLAVTSWRQSNPHSLAHQRYPPDNRRGFVLCALLDSSHLTVGNIGGEVRWLLSNKPKQKLTLVGLGNINPDFFIADI